MTTALEDQLILNGDRSALLREADVRIEPCPRRVRGTLGARTVVDSTAVRYLFERDHLPVYYLPLDAVDAELLVPAEKRTSCSRKGEARYWHLRVGDRLVEDAAWAYEEPLDSVPELAGLIAFYWNKLDHWYEEDDEVFVHARDPYNRVDVLPSSRHVRVEIDGVTVAESRRPHLLYETGLPTRYYLPRADVRLDLLRDSPTETACPYKGRASYFTAQVGDREVSDIAWSYLFPIPEAPKLAQLVAFYDEHVDVWVDGERQDRPASHWS